MNINHYPPVSVVGEPEPGQFRIGPHTDFGTVTILDREPGAGGLQVYSEAAGWEDAPYEPDALTVNIGDLLEYWSGRRWPSGRHRVLPPQKACPRRRPGLADLLLRGQPRRRRHTAGAADRQGVGAGAGHVHQRSSRNGWTPSPSGDARARVCAMRVYLGADHAGYELKQAVIEHLKAAGHEPVDCGAFTYDAEDDYPAFCIAARRKPSPIRAAWASCSAGRATASRSPPTRCPGARCALAWSTETASLARQHNNAQLIGIGGRMHTTEEALAIVDAFLTHHVVGSPAPPTPHRHPRRVRENTRRTNCSRRLVRDTRSTT